MAQVTEQRIAVVTGAGGDIGRAIVVRLARDGFDIAALDVDVVGLARTTSDVEAASVSMVAIPLDVTDGNAVLDVITQVHRDLGGVSVLVNGAGVLRPTLVEEIPEAEWDDVVGVNLKGTFLCSQAVLPDMVERRWGRIVNISSTAGKNVSTVGGAHYTAAKAGVLGFTRHLAKEVAHAGITVNAVCPGLIETAMISNTIPRSKMDEYAASFPIPRLGRPAEVASLISFLASMDAAYITGASLDINGGDLMVG